MKTAKYWAKGFATVQGSLGKKASFSCWRWSDTSLADAQFFADQSAESIAFKLANGETLDRYGYGDRPIREEAIQGVKDAGGREVALVTRNAYGALILNAAQAMFVDIDLPKNAKPAGLMGKLFGKTPPDPAIEALQRIEAWSARQPGEGIRVYRTAAGLRCLFISQPYEPGQAQSQAIMRELQADVLYVRLCQMQECFRARLTPKPWRCGMDNPPSRFPWEGAAQERDYRHWQQQYEHVVARFGVCQLIREFGSRQVHPAIAPVLALHDRFACSPANLPLA
jgi:hypothetical protein